MIYQGLDLTKAIDTFLGGGGGQFPFQLVSFLVLIIPRCPRMNFLTEFAQFPRLCLIL